MPEIQNFTFTHQEIAELLVKQQDLHEGLWGLYIEFGIAGANISQGPGDGNLLPAAVVPVVRIGIQRFDKPNSLTVDAAQTKPAQKQRTSSKRKASVTKSG